MAADEAEPRLRCADTTGTEWRPEEAVDMSDTKVPLGGATFLDAAGADPRKVVPVMTHGRIVEELR